MDRLRLIGALTAAVSLVAWSGTPASAASSVSYETRGAFIEQMVLQVGLKPVYPTTPTFSDVPATNPYYGYVEAAAQAGITNGFAGGTFGPNLPLTRAEAAKYEVVASGHGVAATAITSTSFTDNLTIPTALVGYVGEASALGLLKGFPNGTFQPNADLTTAQETHLLVQLAAVMNSGTAATTLKITASAADVAAGQFVTLSAVAENASGTPVAAPVVTYSVTSANVQSAIVSGNQFVASTSGTYTIEGVAGTASGTVTINVFGTPTALKVNVPSTVVADGTSQTTVTVSVVDANGNVVANDADSITLTSSNTSAVALVGVGGVLGGSATVTASGGVATFTLQGGSSSGASATLTASDASNKALSGSATVTTTGQTATGVAVTATSPFLTANSTSTTTVDVAVVDQGGQPMLYGTYGFTVTLTGPAQFVDGTNTPHTFVYGGNGSTTNYTPVTIEDVQGETGTVTVAVTSGTLTSAQTTLTAVISGAAAGLKITPPTTTSFSEDNGAAGLRFGIQAVDTHGYPVQDSVPVEITVKNSSGAIATNIAIDALTQTTSSGVLDSAAMANGFFTVTNTGTAPDAGTYTVTLSDPAGVLSAPQPVTFTELPGAVYGIALTGPAYVAVTSPQAQITAQIVDRYGNAIADSGIPVTFSSTGSGISPASAVVDTSASGTAIETFTMPAYVGASYPITATTTLGGTQYTTSTFTVAVENSVAHNIAVTMQDAATSGTYANNASAAQSGDLVTVTIKATDQNGIAVPTADKLLISMSGSGTLTNPSTLLAPGGGVGSVVDNGNGTWTVTLAGGTAVFAARAGTSGMLVLTATDQSVAPQVTGSQTFNILAGPVTGFELVDASGQTASSESVTANIPLSLTLRPVDFAGNTAVPSQNYIVGLQGQASGSFRLTQAGANIESAQVYAGSPALPIYYVSGTSATGVALSAANWVSFPANAALTLANGATLVFGTSGGTLTDVSNSAHLSGTTFTAPSSGSGSDTINYVVSGATVFSFQVSY